MRRALLLAGWIASLATIGSAQQAPPAQPPQSGQPPIFRAGIDVMQVDVSVLDKDRRPVRGLTADDFTILEDGKVQKIVGFTAVEVADLKPPAVAWLRDVAPDVTTNNLSDSRLFVLVLDDALIPADSRIVDNAKKIAAKVIDHLNPNDLMTVIFTAANGDAQDFTSDRTKLLAAVNKLNPRYANYQLGYDTGNPPSFDSDGHFYESSVHTLGNVAEYLADAPQRRKTLIYVSPGVPVNYDATSPMLASGVGKGMSDKEFMASLAGQLPDIFREAQRANVTVYPIDPAGKDMELYVSNQLRLLHLASADELAHQIAVRDLDFNSAAAASTGGHVVVNSGSIDDDIAQLFSENGSYYLLGFKTTDPGSGKLHRLSVKVDRPALEVRSRSGYYAPDAAKAEKDTTPALAKAMSSMLPNPDLPMEVTLAPFAATGPEGASVAIVLGLLQPAPAERTVATVELQTTAFTPEGSAKGTKHQHAQVTVRAGKPGEQARYEVLSRIDLKPGRYELRLAAHSGCGPVAPPPVGTTGRGAAPPAATAPLASSAPVAAPCAFEDKIGSLFTEVVVPDFANAALSMSGALIEAKPGPQCAPKDALALLVPNVLPTAARTFTPGDHVHVFVRLYQGLKATLVPVTVIGHIVDTHGATVFDQQDTLAEKDFSSTAHAADERLPLPLDKLASGEYLLTIAAKSGNVSVQRDVRFTVVGGTAKH